MTLNREEIEAAFVDMERDGMTSEEAMEYIDYNCVGAWVGENTPIIVMPLEILR
jgi:hypothetical protein